MYKLLFKHTCIFKRSFDLSQKQQSLLDGTTTDCTDYRLALKSNKYIK